MVLVRSLPEGVHKCLPSVVIVAVNVQHLLALDAEYSAAVRDKSPSLEFKLPTLTIRILSSLQSAVS